MPGDSTRLHDALTQALSRPSRARARLGAAGTSIAFTADDERCTLLLDRDPPAVVQGLEPTEIEITLPGETGRAFADGRLPMTGALARGAATARGPVRRYLAVDAILRALLSLQADDEGAGPEPSERDRLPAAAMTGLTPDIVAIEARNVSRALDGRPILKDLRLQVPEGAISVILGPAGSGKTTLVDLLSGGAAPDSGEVLIRGRALGDMNRSELRSLRRDLGVMPQEGALAERQSVFDNVAAPVLQHEAFPASQLHRVVQEHLEAVALADAADLLPGGLSAWRRRRVALARAMVLEPGFLFADRPETGLDPVRRALLGDLLLDLHAEYGGTMVIASRDVALATAVGDFVALLWRGSILDAGPPEDVLGVEEAFVRELMADSPTRGPGPVT
jgi:phospholipid/cholesterol/gamma-HCH transport system ATP-binding protein